MRADALHVKQLRVRTAGPLASPVGFAARLEDALRTAGRPAAWGGHLVLVRRLSLRLREDAPGFVLARQIEACWRRLAATALPYRSADANAAAVVFADEPGARLALIERLASTKDVSAWYWQRILRAAYAGTPRPGTRATQIAALLAAPWSGAALDADGGARYFADACRAIARPDLLAEVIDALDDTALRALLPRTFAAGETSNDENWPALPTRASEAAQPSELQKSVRRPLAAAARRFARAALRLSHGGVPRPERFPHAHSSVVPPPSARSPGSASSGVKSEEGHVTDWAGLFFALNLFGNVEHPPATAVACVRWLRAIAAFLRIDAADTLHGALDQLALEDEAPGADDPVPLRALRFACLRLTRRPLRRALARGGRVFVSRTHLTISLRLAEVALPVRKAGLDLDPGWMPVFGRVVRFQYD